MGMWQRMVKSMVKRGRKIMGCECAKARHAETAKARVWARRTVIIPPPTVIITPPPTADSRCVLGCTTGCARASWPTHLRRTQVLAYQQDDAH